MKKTSRGLSSNEVAVNHGSLRINEAGIEVALECHQHALDGVIWPFGPGGFVERNRVVEAAGFEPLAVVICSHRS